MTEPSYVDSNVFILPVLGEKSERANGARSVLERIEAGKIVAYTSVLTWDEVVWVVSRLLAKEDGVQVGQKLLSFPGLRFLDVTAATVSRAQALSESLGLAPRDAIHCASALGKGLKSFISDDSGLDAVPGITRARLESFVR